MKNNSLFFIFFAMLLCSSPSMADFYSDLQSVCSDSRRSIRDSMKKVDQTSNPFAGHQYIKNLILDLDQYIQMISLIERNTTDYNQLSKTRSLKLGLSQFREIFRGMVNVGDDAEFYASMANMMTGVTKKQASEAGANISMACD